MSALRTRVVLVAAALIAALSVATGAARSHRTVQPAPNGRGPVALLVGGGFGSSNVLALDANGRVVASGQGDGVVSQISLCPGGRRIAEFVEFGTAETVRRFELVIREERTLRLLRRQRLRARDVGVIQCLDPSGEQLVVFTSGGPDTPTGRLVRMTPTTSWTSGRERRTTRP